MRKTKNRLDVMKKRSLGQITFKCQSLHSRKRDGKKERTMREKKEK
jgi:hypothetical protein